MGYGAPNSVRLIIDTDNTDRCSRTSGRAASFRVCTKAINSAVQSYKYTVCIYQTDSADIFIADAVFSEGFFIRIFCCLFYRSQNPNIVIFPLDLKDLNKDSLTGLEL